MQQPIPQADAGATPDALFAEVYDRLKSIAARQRRGSRNGLATTELVHELYLRMASGNEKRFAQPVQFFAYAARAMRHILIDSARSQLLLKVGGDRERVSLTDPQVDALGVDPGQALQLDEALRALEGDDPRAAQVLELHHFAGLELERIGELLGVSVRTIDRDLRYARAFMAARVRD
jgi:RNA polymerase sigma factor (TIGR02999 family)